MMCVLRMGDIVGFLLFISNHFFLFFIFYFILFVPFWEGK